MESIKEQGTQKIQMTDDQTVASHQAAKALKTIVGNRTMRAQKQPHAMYTILLLISLLKLSQQQEVTPDDSTNIDKCPTNSKYISLLENSNEKKKCHAYGCQMHPLDLMFENEMEEIVKIANEEESRIHSSKVATLTLTGSKGKNTLNQDR